MLEKVMNNEMADSFKQSLLKRINNPVYGTFILSWIVFHWKFVFTMFFVSEEKIFQLTGLLKNDYLSKEFFNYSDVYFYISWITPFIATWLLIWILPKHLFIRAVRKEHEYEFDKSMISISYDKKLNEENVKRLEIIGKNTQKTREVKEEQKKIEAIDPEELWRKEYEEFKKTSLYQEFHFIVESIYSHKGKINTYIDQYRNFKIPNNILVYSHVNNLVTLNKEKDSIEITEKGKFFVKFFSDDQDARLRF